MTTRTYAVITMPLQFECPTAVSAEKVISQLQHEAAIRPLSKQSVCKTYYDSFDWRLYANGLSCEFNRTTLASSLILRSLNSGRIIASTALKTMPVFGKELEPGLIRDTLAPLLDMRALVPLCSVDVVLHQLAIMGDDEKTALQLLIEEYGALNTRILLQAEKGRRKTAKHIARCLMAMPGVTATDKPSLLAALHYHGRKPKDYSSKLNINLVPDMRADIASKYIYSHLLKALKTNEQGTIADIDSEFLHDFRVAVRRTRAGLSQIKGIFPANIAARHADFFSWLGQITGPTRDLDVYLLNFARYKSSLPESIREELNPLYDFLLVKQQKAQQELAAKLQSPKYRSALAEWEQYLKEPCYKQALEPSAKLSIKQLADRRLWKVFARVLKEGKAITGTSEAEALHHLRKSCKKLRYLMEFFQSLYPESEIKRLIKNLKGLQEVLGDFQDYAVQEHTLKQFSDEMIAQDIPAATFLAMGVLIQDLDAHRCNARNEFAARFEDFSRAENRAAFKLLTAPKSPD
ncbi:MAG: CHAD domain-containing protein [Methylobacter sp.]|nr:CHAD domain-containing protein [Methylobacter sp.]